MKNILAIAEVLCLSIHSRFLLL